MTYRFSRPSTKLRSSSSFLFLCGTFMCVVANVVAVVVARGFQWHNFFGSAGVPSYFRGVVATDFRVIWRTPKMHRGEKTGLLFLSDAQQRMQSPRQARSEIPATSPASSQHAPTISKNIKETWIFFFFFNKCFAKSADLIYVSQQHDSCSLDFTSFFFFFSFRSGVHLSSCPGRRV